MFSYACIGYMHVYPRLAPIACFPAHGSDNMFSLVRLTVAHFPVSSAWHRLHVFPRLAPVHLYPRLATVTRFFALGTGGFPRFTPVTNFLTFGNGYMFFRAWHRLHFSVLAACFSDFEFIALTVFDELWFWV